MVDKLKIRFGVWSSALIDTKRINNIASEEALRNVLERANAQGSEQGRNIIHDHLLMWGIKNPDEHIIDHQVKLVGPKNGTP